MQRVKSFYSRVLLPEIQETLAFAVNIDLFRSPVAGAGKDLVAGIRAVEGVRKLLLRDETIMKYPPEQPVFYPCDRNPCRN
jgi:hypothetical protein